MASMVADVIISNEKVVGKGKSEDDPSRQVIQIFTCDGQLIVEIDPWKKTHLYNPKAIADVFSMAKSLPD